MPETAVQVEKIVVRLSRDQIGDLVYQQLEDEEDAENMHPRHAIDFAINALDRLGLLVRD